MKAYTPHVIKNCYCILSYRQWNRQHYRHNHDASTIATFQHCNVHTAWLYAFTFLQEWPMCYTHVRNQFISSDSHTGECPAWGDTDVKNGVREPYQLNWLSLQLSFASYLTLRPWSGSHMFFRNVWFFPSYTVSQLRRRTCFLNLTFWKKNTSKAIPITVRGGL
jgi:hypothetical protein